VFRDCKYNDVHCRHVTCMDGRLIGSWIGIMA